MRAFDVTDGRRHASVRRVERLRNGLWLVHYHGGLTDTFRLDPWPMILSGQFPKD